MNDLMEDLVFDIQLFADGEPGFDPWGEFNADDESGDDDDDDDDDEPVTPVDPTSEDTIDPISEDKINDSAIDDEGNIDVDQIYDGDTVRTEEIKETAEEVLSAVDTTDADATILYATTEVTAEKSDSSSVTYTQITAVAGVRIKASSSGSGSNATLGSGSKKTRISLNASSNVDVMFEYDDSTSSYSTDPTQIRAKDGSGLVIGGASGVGMAVSGGQVNVDLSSGKPSLFQILANAVFSFFGKVSATSSGDVLYDANYEYDETSGVTITFEGFDDEDNNYVTPDGKKIGTIDIANTEDATVTVDGSYAYTFAMHDSDGNSISSDAFELKYVADGDYTFTVLENAGIKLDLSDLTVKDGKTLNVVSVGGADQIVPVTDADGGEIKILGTTYKYTAVADSESYFALTDGAVTGFVLGTAGDTIVLDDSSTFAVYDIDDLENNLLNDITFSGGELALTKDSSTTNGYSIAYYFTSAGDTITLTEDTADGFEMFYQSKKVPYDVVEPLVSGGYTVTMTAKDEFTISNLEEDASVTTTDGVTVEFENAGGSVILAATTNSTNLTAALTIAGVTSNGGAIEFSEDAADLFADGITINGSTVQIADVDGALTYNADGTIVVDDTVYAIGDGTYYGYEIAGDADGTVKLTLDDNNVVTAITDLNLGTAKGDFSGDVTVNGVTIQTDDTSLVVTGDSDATGIDAISGLDSGKNVSLSGSGSLTVNDADFSYSGSSELIVVTGATEGIASVTGIASGDTVTLKDDDAIVVLPTSGDEAEVTVNGVKYTFTGDSSNVSIDGAGNVGGLDEDAQLVVEGKTGTIYVNGTSGLDATKTIVGTYDGTKARVVDSSNPIINKNTSVSEVEDMLGLSYSGTQVVGQTSASELDYTEAGEKKKVTLGQGDQTVTFGEYGQNEVVVADDSTGDKTIELGTRGDAVIVQGSDTDSTINVIGGAGADSIVVQDKAPVEFDMSKGGADKVITFASSNAKVTLDTYDINSGGGLVVHEAAASDIADAIDDGLIQFTGNKIVEVYRDGSRAADITVNNKSGDPATMINLFNSSGDSQKVGFTGTAGGELDASGVSGDLVLIGNKDGNKTGGSTLKAGSGDDTIYAGSGDRVDAGAGYNTVNLGYGGATVVATEGYTTINNLMPGKAGDVLAISSADDVTFDGSNLIVSGSGYAVTASLPTDYTGTDYVNQVFEISGQTVEAAIAATGKDITVSDDYDVPDYFLGNGGVNFKDYTGEVVIDAKGGWKTTEIGGKEVRFSNTLVSVQGGAGTTQLKGYEANDIFAAGSGVTSLYGGAGNNTLIGYSGSDKQGPTEFFVIGNEDGAKHTIQNFQFGTDFINTDYASNDITKVTVDGSGSNVLLTVTNRNTGAAETATIEGAVDAGNIKIGGLSEGNVAVGQVGSVAVTVDGEANYLAATVAGGATVNVSSALTEKTAIWLDNRGDKWFSDNFAVIDARNSTAEVTLAGDAKANTIYGGAGNASLWGGSGSAGDYLVGGTARNSFYYEQGNGADTISGANDGDVINLFDTSLENITNANITSGGVTLEFTNGGSIQVNSNAAVDYRLADGTTYNADHNTHTWVKKS